MELSQLRYFAIVAEHLSFTRAAVVLSISQPALSRAVAKLEQELGQPVFGRESRKLALTDAGRTLLGRAKQILALVDDVQEEVRDNGETGRIRLGAIPTVAPYFLPAVLRSFAAARPKASTIVHEEVTERLLLRLLQGELDLALLAAPIEAKHLKSTPLLTEELLLVLPLGHPLAEKTHPTIADLRSLPFVLLDETHCLSGDIASLCRRKSFQPIAVEQTSQLTMVQELVSLGHGVSLIPEMARRLDQSPTRIYRSMTGPRPERTIVMAWNPYRFQSKLLKHFREHLLHATAQHNNR